MSGGRAEGARGGASGLGSRRSLALAETGHDKAAMHTQRDCRAVAAVTYRTQWRPRASKAFLSLDKPVRLRIGEALDALAADPRPAAGKMITGAHGVLRIRAGDYRVPSTTDEG